MKGPFPGNCVRPLSVDFDISQDSILDFRMFKVLIIGRMMTALGDRAALIGVM